MIIGTKTQQDAKEGKGLILWMQDKPSWLNRFYNKLFLGIRWVDKDDYTPPVKTVQETAETKVVMPKQRTYKKKNTDGANKERRNTKSSSTSNQ